MFASRTRPGTGDRLRRAVWPRCGWRRALSYHGHRLGRLKAAPHQVAAGLACGVGVSLTPLFGLQFILAAALAALLRGSVVASILGTFFANPWTLPFIWIGTFRLGSWMLFGDSAVAGTNGDLGDAVEQAANAIATRDIDLVGQRIWPVWLSMFIGSLLPAALLGAAVYWPSRFLLTRYQERRRALHGPRGHG